MIGTLTKNDTISPYQPPQEVRDFTKKIKDDVQVGDEVLNKSYEEFNNRTLVDRMNIDQRIWNNYVEDPSNDPDERWRWHGIRPITRNKIISIAAHVTAQIMIPNVFPQNDTSPADEQFSRVMRWLMKWNIDNSDYELSFLFAVLGALINPVTYLKADYFEVMQKIKERGENGELVTSEILDETLSGFRASVIPPDEILIANAYEFELQRQRFICHRRYIEYDDAVALYEDHDNWRFVRPGIRTIFNHENNTFYDQYDQTLGTLVEDITYYNRREDTEVNFVNGVYLGDDNVNDNRMKHRDNRNAPKYPFAKTGYEPIDEKKFFFYKSAVNKLSHDQELVDRMWQMVMDGTFLSVMQPVAAIGEDQVDSSVIFPGKVTSFSRDSSITPIDVGHNINTGYQALGEIERSMTQSTASPDVRQGIQTEGNPTAFEISRLETNANIQLGLFGKTLGRFVVDFGHLMVDDILRHQTVAEVEEIVGGVTRLKFREFLLPDEREEGKNVSKVIRFSDTLNDLDENKRKKRNFELLDEAGSIDANKSIYEVNPFLFSKSRFRIVVDPDALTPKNENIEKALNLEAYDRMMRDPVITSDEESMRNVTRDFLLETFAEDDAGKYLPDQTRRGRQQILQQLTGRRQQGGTSNLVTNLTGTRNGRQLVGQLQDNQSV